LLSSELIYIVDPETKCLLTISLPGLDDLEGDVIEVSRKYNSKKSIKASSSSTMEDGKREDAYMYVCDDDVSLFFLSMIMLILII